MQESIFKVSSKDLLEKQKFFQCFVCLEDFGLNEKYPIQICKNQHFMCQQCVNNKCFKKVQNNNKLFLCGVCSYPIEQAQLRKSSFLLNIKEFVQTLLERQQIRKKKYKQFSKQQIQIIQQLMMSNVIKEQRISELEQIIMQNTDIQLQPSKIKQKNTDVQVQNNDQNDINIELDKKLMQMISYAPNSIKGMLQTIIKMKQEIQNDQQLDKQIVKKQLKQLQKRQSFLKEIQEQVEQEFQYVQYQ